jgi:hypothetical protein
VSKWEWLSAGVIMVGVMLLFVGRRHQPSTARDGVQNDFKLENQCEDR